MVAFVAMQVAVGATRAPRETPQPAENATIRRVVVMDALCT